MKSIGDKFEVEAVNLVRATGMRILARNFSGKTGEVDIVAVADDTLVFLEVRARRHPRYASAAGSVDRRKQLRILRTAQLFLQRYPQWAHMPCRFDVIAFDPRQSLCENRVTWIHAAFTA